jgi:hypothetical protein
LEEIIIPKPTKMEGLQAVGAKHFEQFGGFELARM